MIGFVRRRVWGEPAPNDELDDLDRSGAPLLDHRSFTARQYERLVDTVLVRATPAIGEYLLSYVVAPGAPPPAGWNRTWADIEADLQVKFRSKLGVEENLAVRRVRMLRRVVVQLGRAVVVPRLLHRCPQNA